MTFPHLNTIFQSFSECKNKKTTLEKLLLRPNQLDNRINKKKLKTLNCIYTY